MAYQSNTVKSYSMLVAQIAYFVGVAQLGVGVASEQEIPDGK